MKNVLVIDSGVGAVSIASEIKKLVNANLFIYIDNLHSPLGEKSREQLIKIADDIVAKCLKKFRLDLIVIACNTLTVATIDYLRKKYNINFVGTEPNVKIKEDKAIIICTTYTFFNCKILKSSPFDKLPMPKLATLIDKNLHNLWALSGYLSPFFKKLEIENYNAISLGCTHYTYIEKIIKKFLPKIKIYQNKNGVAKRVQCLVQKLSCFNDENLFQVKRKKRLKRKRKNYKNFKGKVKFILSKKDLKFKKQLKYFFQL